MNTRIRQAREADVAAILDITNHEILHSTVLYEYEPRSLETQMEWFHDKLAQGWPVLVAEVDETVVGFGTYGTFRQRIAYRFSVEHSVYVHKGHRGKSIGNALMVELICQARANGFHTMIAGIDSSNMGSVAFHRKFGFEVVGTFKEVGFKFDRWLDVLFMQLILRP
ncbi:MAG: GNAT family N-acetyltransferase [Flavobacteriales bacterium]|nr:GNAT family N-acetyltransferase [Flavobacteriales bacterium]